MNLEIVGVENLGDIDRERLVLKAATDVDVGRYAVFVGDLVTETTVASGPVHSAYWFMDKKIKAGDFVVLYSKVGERSEKANDKGIVSHFFYWGRTASCWNKSKSVPVLVNTVAWNILPTKR